MSVHTGPYASTTCLSGGLESTLEAYAGAGLEAVELGYCGDPDVDVDALVEAYDFEYVAHNYFLPCEDEFFLNLASSDDAIRERSVRYVQDAVEFCDAHGIEMYTFHGGFRVDPTLSLEFPTVDVPPYAAAWDRFVASIQRVLNHAEDFDVDLGVENNVVEREHLVDGEPVLMFSQPGEFAQLFEQVDPESLGVLLDVGHLNVSAHSLGYDRERVLEQVAPHVRGLHLHWNDRERDTHSPVEDASFVNTVLERFPRKPRSLEVRCPDVWALEEELSRVTGTAKTGAPEDRTGGAGR